MKKAKKVQPHFICHWYCMQTCSFLLASGDAFSRSAFNQWLTIMNVVIPVYSTLPLRFRIFPWLRNPPYNAWHLASITILILLVCCSIPSFSPVVLAWIAHCSSSTHDSLNLFTTDYLPVTSWRLLLCLIRILRLRRALLLHLNAGQWAKQHSFDLLLTMCNITSPVVWRHLWAMLLDGLFYKTVRLDHANNHVSPTQAFFVITKYKSQINSSDLSSHNYQNDVRNSSPYCSSNMKKFIMTPRTPKGTPEKNPKDSVRFKVLCVWSRCARKGGFSQPDDNGWSGIRIMAQETVKQVRL